jgi:hypothetical protein
MNGVLTKGAKKYWLISIDGATRFCYVYLLQTKDEVFDYFNIYKAEVENQLERKIKCLKSDLCGGISLKSLMNSVRNMVLFMRGRLPIVSI